MSDSINPQPEAAASSGTNPLMKKVRIAAIPVLLAAGAYAYFHRNAVDCSSSGAKDLVVQIAKDHQLLASNLGASKSPMLTVNSDDQACLQDANCAPALKSYNDAVAAAIDLAKQCQAIPVENRGDGGADGDQCPELSSAIEDLRTFSPNDWGTTYDTTEHGYEFHDSKRRTFMAANVPPVMDRLKAAESAKSQARSTMEKSMLQKASADWDKIASAIQYRLDNIIMTDKNEQTGAVMCKATLFGSVEEWGEKSQNIRYSVEKTSEGKLFATIFGR